MRKFPVFFLVLILSFSFISCLPYARAQEKTYLKVFEKDGTSLKIPTISLSDSVVSYQNTKDFYQFNITKTKYDGIYEYTFPLETKGLEFYRQPPLTEEFKQEDCEIWTTTHIKTKKGLECWRPENVVESYAVYMTKPLPNMPSKLYHIYRPLLIDAKGAKSWANLSMTKTSMSIICDRKFLETAVYPIVIDPTFGYTNIGGSVGGLGTNYAYGSKFVAPEDGTVTKLTAYTYTQYGSGDVKGVMYSDNAGAPNSKLTDSSGVTINATPAWVDLDVSDQEVTNGVAYWFMEFIGVATYIPYDSGDANQFAYSNGGASWSYPTVPDPYIYPTYLAWKMSIYATYTTSGGSVYVSIELDLSVNPTAGLSASKFLRFSGSQTTVVQTENGQIKNVCVTNVQEAQPTSETKINKQIHATTSATSFATTICTYAVGVYTVGLEAFETAIGNAVSQYAKFVHSSIIIATITDLSFYANKILYFVNSATSSVTAIFSYSKQIIGYVSESVTNFLSAIPSAIAYCTKVIESGISEISVLDFIVPVASFFYWSLLNLSSEEWLIIGGILAICVFGPVIWAITILMKRKRED